MEDLVHNTRTDMTPPSAAVRDLRWLKKVLMKLSRVSCGYSLKQARTNKLLV